MVRMSPEERRTSRITGKVSRTGEGEKHRGGEEKQCIKAQNGKVNWATVHEWDAKTFQRYITHQYQRIGIYKWKKIIIIQQNVPD